MNFLEKDLEEIIYTSERGALACSGLNITGKLYRQFKIGKYGIADLVCISRTLNNPNIKEYTGKIVITVYELKKNKVGISAFLQAVGYTYGIYRYLTIRNKSIDIELRIVLIGNEIDTNSTFCYLKNIMPCRDTFLNIYKYDIKLNGLSFISMGEYSLSDEGFNIKPVIPF